MIKCFACSSRYRSHMIIGIPYKFIPSLLWNRRRPNTYKHSSCPNLPCFLSARTPLWRSWWSCSNSRIGFDGTRYWMDRTLDLPKRCPRTVFLNISCISLPGIEGGSHGRKRKCLFWYHSFCCWASILWGRCSLIRSVGNRRSTMHRWPCIFGSSGRNCAQILRPSGCDWSRKFGPSSGNRWVWKSNSWGWKFCWAKKSTCWAIWPWIGWWLIYSWLQLFPRGFPAATAWRGVLALSWSRRSCGSCRWPVCSSFPLSILSQMAAGPLGAADPICLTCFHARTVPTYTCRSLWGIVRGNAHAPSTCRSFSWNTRRRPGHTRKKPRLSEAHGRRGKPDKIDSRTFWRWAWSRQIDGRILGIGSILRTPFSLAWICTGIRDTKAEY